MRFCVCWAVFVFASSCAGVRVVDEDADAPAVTVVSWNVNYGGVGVDVILDVLDDLDADVVVLQETTPQWERAIRARFTRRYPGMVFHDCCGAGGLAVLAKGRVVVDVVPAVSWFPAAHAVVDTPLGPLQVLDVHLRPPFGDAGSSMASRVVSGAFSTPAIRQDEMKTFLLSLDDDAPAIVAGDFNEGAGGAVDAVKDAGFASALDDAGVDDATWHWEGVPFRLRLDHVFYDVDDLALVGARVVDVSEFSDAGSDHFPVVARLQRRTTVR